LSRESNLKYHLRCGSVMCSGMLLLTADYCHVNVIYAGRGTADWAVSQGRKRPSMWFNVFHSHCCHLLNPRAVILQILTDDELHYM